MLVDGGLDVWSWFRFRYTENKVPKLLHHKLALVAFIVLSLFNVLLRFILFLKLFLLGLVFSEENYKFQTWWWRFWRYNELGASSGWSFQLR